MAYVIVGLGNPGDEYRTTRHNVGRMAVEHLHDAIDAALWKDETKKPKMLHAVGKVGGKKATLVLPNTFMNDSGKAVAHFVKNKKDAGNTVIVYDDLDLPLGTVKISHGRSSGGHNGVESVIRALKTRDFARIRIGVSPKTPKGVAKKPVGSDRVLKFLLGPTSGDEMKVLKKVFKTVHEILDDLVANGHQSAMTKFN